jgi:hypothetical protein
MSGRCVSLIVSLQDSSQGLEGTKVLEIADEIEASVSQPVIVFPNLISIENSIIIRVNRKVNEWSSWSQLKSFLAQSEIKDGIDRLHRDIDTAMMKFNVSQPCSPPYFSYSLIDANGHANDKAPVGVQGNSGARQSRDPGGVANNCQKSGRHANPPEHAILP